MVEVIVQDSVKWTEIVTVAFVMASFVLLVAAGIFAGLQVGETRRTREAQLMMELTNRWDNDDLLEARRLAALYESNPESLTKVMQTDREERYQLERVPNFFEDLGVLVSEKSLAPRLVAKLMAGSVERYWALYSPYIVEQQDERKSEYRWFRDLQEKVAEAAKKLEETQK
ncbi:MAG: hypothetical protein IH958_00320 [Chloroflexi bacterium]|nr:hypothetical protein [Chloroflexota bacterium]